MVDRRLDEHGNDFAEEFEGRFTDRGCGAEL